MFTSSITCGFMMFSLSVATIVTYPTFHTVFAVIMSCYTIDRIIRHVNVSLVQSNICTILGISPTLKGIVSFHYRNLLEFTILERCYWICAIIHSRGLCGIAVYPCYCECLNIGTCAYTVIIGMAFFNIRITTLINLGMSAVYIDCIRALFCMVVLIFIAFNRLGLCKFFFGNPLNILSIKYCSVGCHLRCDTCCFRGDFRCGIHRHRFEVFTVFTFTGSSTLCIICTPGERNRIILVTGSFDNIIGIIVSTYRAGISGITVNRTCGCGYYTFILMTEFSYYIISISVTTYRAGVGCITVSRTCGGSYNGVVFVSQRGNVYNILCLFGCPIFRDREACCVGCSTLAFTGCCSLFCTGNSSGCSLGVTAVTLTTCCARFAIFAPSVGRITVDVFSCVFLTADVTVVVVVGSYIGTNFAIFNFTAAVVTYVVFVG